MTAEHVRVVVNGDARNLPANATLLDVLARFELDPRAVVVELNRAIVRHGKLGETVVRDGDTLELVHFVGGG